MLFRRLLFQRRILAVHPGKSPTACTRVQKRLVSTENGQNQRILNSFKIMNVPKKEKDASENVLPLEIIPPPEYLAHRVRIFQELKALYDEEIKQKPNFSITITLPDGQTKNGIAWETSPMDIAAGISTSLVERTVIAKVNGTLWDLTRPLEESCMLELLDFENNEGKRVFWYSSAQVLGEACERHYGCHLCIGPPLEDGFYYEMSMADSSRVVTLTDYLALETIVKNIVEEKQPFERLAVSKNNLLHMFKHNRYKQHIIKYKIPDNTSTTVYRCGSLIDLCIGPHIPHTGLIKSFQITKNSSSYFLGDANNDPLQRIYGISFPDSKKMIQYNMLIEEARRRDHRKLGKEQELFFFHELSPGSCFLLPHGARVYNTLIDMIRSEHRKRGFDEVITPNMYNVKLWETSGHWLKYKEEMFTLEVEKEQFALKPMNCPGHCLLFGHKERSYRELPIRFADFGVLHRNETSGALTGLSRVRRFQQDDAHIFCRGDQLEVEIAGCFDFLEKIYGIFGFDFTLKLSTRPENFIGDIAIWDNAEKKLEDAIKKFSPEKWELNPGDGAFYGPKIDIIISDALKRKHQCATIQLDFQLPERFQLEYRTESMDTGSSFARPVIIHRAILGSVERMMAILIEHFAGRFPFWLSPRQISVIPVALPFFDYAKEVTNKLNDAGLFADADLSDNKLAKKIRNSEIAYYNFIFVVGSEEAETRSVNVRNRDNLIKGKSETISLDDVVAKLTTLKNERRLKNEI